MSSATELQSLEREIAILRKVLKTCTSSETTSVAAIRIYNAITTQQPSVHNNNKMILDHFAPLPIPKGTTTTTTTTTGTSSSTTNTNNSNAQQRTSYNPDESGGGCCVVC